MMINNPKALLIFKICFKAQGRALFVITWMVKFSPEALITSVIVILSLLRLTLGPSELAVEYKHVDVVWCCKADSSMLIIHSSETSINASQILWKCFSIWIKLKLLCSPHIFTLDVETCFKYFSNHPFEATNVWRWTISDYFKHFSKSFRILFWKNRAFFWAPLQSRSLRVHRPQHTYAIDASCG